MAASLVAKVVLATTNHTMNIASPSSRRPQLPAAPSTAPRHHHLPVELCGSQAQEGNLTEQVDVFLLQETLLSENFRLPNYRMFLHSWVRAKSGIYVPHSCVTTSPAKLFKTWLSVEMVSRYRP